MKLLIKLVAVLVLIVILAVFGVFYYIDTIAKSAIERGGTYALGVDTTLHSADVGILSGSFDMSGLNVSNPGGFATPHFMNLGSGGVAVSLATLRQETVELPHLKLSDLSVNLEKKEGKANYKVIMDNLGKFESKSEPQKSPEPKSEPKKFIVREIDISNIKVHVDLLPVGGDLTKLEVPIDRIYLTDVGTESDKGVVIGELMDIIIKAVVMAVIEKGGNLIPADMLGDLQNQLASLKGLQEMGIGVLAGTGENVEALTKQAEQFVEQAQGAVDDVKKQVDETTKKIEDVGKSVEDAGDKAKDALDDLFGGGGKKKDE